MADVVEGESQSLGAEGGVEAGEARVDGEEGEEHGGGDSEVGGVGLLFAAKDVASQADGEHAEGDGGERAAEESHGCSGEVEEVSEGEVVELGILGEEGGDVWRSVGAGDGLGGGDGEVSADCGDYGGEGDEDDGGPAEGAASGLLVSCVGAGEEAGGHEGEGWDGGEGVVLLAGGEGEEAEDEQGPEDEGASGFVVAGIVVFHPSRWGCEG